MKLYQLAYFVGFFMASPVDGHAHGKASKAKYPTTKSTGKRKGTGTKTSKSSKASKPASRPVSCPPGTPIGSGTKTLYEIIRKDKNFSTLHYLVKQAGLKGALDDPCLGATAFIPTNDAFDALPELDVDNEALQTILLTHVVSGIFDSSIVLGLSPDPITTLSGAPITMTVNDPVSIEVAGESNLANPAVFPVPHVIKTDIEACNGIAHVINYVIVPDLA